MLKGIVKSIRSVTNSGAATPDREEKTVNKNNLFETIPPECDHDCESCTIKLPANFKIEEDEELFNTANVRIAPRFPNNILKMILY